MIKVLHRRLARTCSAVALILIGLVVGNVSRGARPALQNSNSLPQEQTKIPYKPVGNEATLTGRITFVGDPQRVLQIDTSADPSCSGKGRLPTEHAAIVNGMVANVFVYVKGLALEKLVFEAPSSPAVLDQRRCRFVPHVMGIQTGQTLMITNSDSTQHNIHPTPKNNAEFNMTQPSGAEAIVKQFSRPEIMVPFKCNQHPWMKAYVGVLSHPFFAVTDKNGFYSISGLPPGTYTVVAWHERFGERTADVTVAPYESRSLDFDFQDRPN